MATAISYGFSKDLRAEFRALNFPISDQVYDELYQRAIQAESGFSMNLNPATQSIAPGASASLTVEIRGINGFTSPVSLSATLTPPDNTINANFSSNPVLPGGSTTLNIGIQANTSQSSYAVTVVGTSAGL